MRLKTPMVAVSTIALLTVAACGGSGTTGDDNAGPGPDQGDVSKAQGGGAAGQGKDPTRSEGPAPEIEGAQSGGTLKEISFAGLNTMDPSEAYYTNTISILTSLVTRTLTQYVYDEASGDMVLIPDLATDLGTPNDDFTEWKFTIREGVRYENGQEVTCDDVAFGLKRSMDRATFPEGADYSNVYFLDGDKYKGPYKSGNEYDGVTCDGADLTIKMSTPFPDMDYYGAFPAMGPIPEGKASDPAKYRLHPWATGPYMFDEYTPEKSLTLVKNPEWDPATDPGRHQYIDEYQMQFDVPTAKIDQIMLQDQGDAQTTVSSDNVDAADYLPFKQDAPDRLIIGTDPCTFMWFPDYRKIKEIEVRQALAYAYPYKDSIAAAGLIEGVTRTLGGTNIMPPGIPEREEFNPLPGHEPGSTDPEKSKQLLAEAGYKPGEYEISFLYISDDPSLVDQQKQISAGLEAGGFKANPVATTIAEFSTVRADPDAPINVRSGGWCSDWPSGGSWFPPVFGSPNLEEGLGANYAVFSEPEVDKEIDRIQSLPIEEQPAAWNEMDQMIQEKYFPVIVTGYGGVAMMRGSKVQNMQVDSTTGMPHWKDMWLSQ